jgi:hypothetical protein
MAVRADDVGQSSAQRTPSPSHWPDGAPQDSCRCALGPSVRRIDGMACCRKTRDHALEQRPDQPGLDVSMTGVSVVLCLS